jgi:hypothetical protein
MTQKENIEFQLKTIESTLLTITDPKTKSVLIETKYDLRTRLQRLAEQYAQNNIKNACCRCLKEPAKDGCELCVSCRKDIGIE